jgi:16S rRNA processing protein RimM
LSREHRAPPRLVGLGQVSGAHGIRGAVKVRADAGAATTDPEVFAALGAVTIGGRDYKILEADRYKNQILLYLEGIQTRSQAEELAGKAVVGDPRRFPRLPPGEYYWFQVLGLPVYEAADGTLLGYLEEVIPTPAHDVYAVRLNRREVLLPAVEEVVLEINLSQGFIKVSLPEGLPETYAD